MDTFQTLATESFSSNWLENKSFPSSLVCLTSYSQDFDFDIVLPKSSNTLVDAGDIFLNGKIVPSFVNQSNSKVSSYPCNTPIAIMHSPSKVHDSLVYQKNQKNFTILRKWRNSSKKVLKKCLRVLFIESSHEHSREGFQSESNGRNTSFDVDDSIYDAIIHCKRSFSKQLT